MQNPLILHCAYDNFSCRISITNRHAECKIRYAHEFNKFSLKKLDDANRYQAAYMSDLITILEAYVGEDTGVFRHYKHRKKKEEEGT